MTAGSEVTVLCRELMKTDVRYTSAEALVEDAARTMRDENIGFLPVCDAAGRVEGTITDRDIAIRVVAESRAPETRVGDVMTCEVVACQPEDDIDRAEFLMGRAKVSRVMCIDEETGRLAGVISLSDIAQAEEAAASAETLREVSSREVRR